MHGEKKTLLILGNGFDMSCGLESSYGSFFLDRYTKEVISIYKNTEIYDNKLFNDFNYLDFVFLSSSKEEVKEILWSDIESKILEVVKPNTSYNYYEIFDHWINFFIKRNKGQVKNRELHVERSSIVNGLMCSEELKRIQKYVVYDDYEVEQYKKDRELFPYKFIESISVIEKAFKQYMKKNIDNYPEYYENAEILFDKLLGGEAKRDETYLINFNYTTPNKKDFYEYNNIHGSLDNNENVIFGIDENKIKYNSFEYKLSKTYRKISLDSKIERRVKKLPKEVRNITFYGHSLAEADYSYFQSIFDYYNIYDSNVNLIFYYSIYDSGKAEEIFERQMEQVSKLLKKYGKTMSNKNHGKNLLHKINLEGRLYIREILID